MHSHERLLVHLLIIIKHNKLTKNIYRIACNAFIFYKCHIENSSHFQRINVTVLRLPQALAKCCWRAVVAYLNGFVFTYLKEGD